MDCESKIFQLVRLVDVFFLGPAMVKIGSQVGGRLGNFVAIAGVATIVFNGLTLLDITTERGSVL